MQKNETNHNLFDYTKFRHAGASTRDIGELLAYMEEYERLICARNAGSSFDVKRFAYVSYELACAIGPNWHKYPPQSTGIAWSYDYAELIRNSQEGRERLARGTK